MRRAAGAVLLGFLLAGCGATEPDGQAAATTSSAAPASTTAPTSTAAPRTTLPPDRQDQVFSASMDTLGLTPDVGTVDELRASADNVCTGYSAGASYPEQLSTLVNSGMTLDQATSFEETAVTIFCPEFLGG